MVSKVMADPFAGEAQWVIEVATRMLPRSSDVSAWYAKESIPALQNRTAADLVSSGQAQAVVAYLESLGEAQTQDNAPEA